MLGCRQIWGQMLVEHLLPAASLPCLELLGVEQNNPLHPPDSESPSTLQTNQ